MNEQWLNSLLKIHFSHYTFQNSLVHKSAGIWDGLVNPIYSTGLRVAIPNFIISWSQLNPWLVRCPIHCYFNLDLDQDHFCLWNWHWIGVFLIALLRSFWALSLNFIDHSDLNNRQLLQLLSPRLNPISRRGGGRLTPPLRKNCYYNP